MTVNNSTNEGVCRRRQALISEMLPTQSAEPAFRSPKAVTEKHHDGTPALAWGGGLILVQVMGSQLPELGGGVPTSDIFGRGI